MNSVPEKNIWRIQLFYQWGVFFMFFNLAANGLYAQSDCLPMREIHLTDYDTLLIIEPDPFSIQLQLKNQYGLSVCVDAAGFNTRDDLVFYPVKLNAETDSAAVVILYHRSSTYGASDAYVVWRDKRLMYNSWWIDRAPCDVAAVRDVDQDGVFEILDLMETLRCFRFHQGRFELLKTHCNSQ